MNLAGPIIIFSKIKPLVIRSGIFLYKKLLKAALKGIGIISRPVQNVWVVLLPACYAKYYYKKVTNRKLNLKNPQDYNEKVQWLKIYSDTSSWTMLADKYKVRRYVEECGLEHILVDLYGVWGKAEEIDFSVLPNSFILKTNNGCGTNVLVYDKRTIDENRIKDLLKNWLKVRDSLISFQPHMWNIERKIIAEELLFDGYNEALSSSIIDYKFFCFHGEPEILKVYYDRKNKVGGSNFKESKVTKRTQPFDLGWRLRPEIVRDPEMIDLAHQIPKPKCLSEMIKICRILSKPFPQVRVDLYEVNNKVYFGELTFTPGAMDYFTHDFYLKMGAKIDLSTVRQRRKLLII
ncbi:MAG: hypothetical protein GX660_06460 [Clostridiaceae bacterium]|nr:hypothetical protein [Clostridiaceae bacterium]